MHHNKNNHIQRQIGNRIAIAAASFLLTTHAYAATGGVTPGATIIDQVITWASALGLAYMTSWSCGQAINAPQAAQEFKIMATCC